MIRMNSYTMQSEKQFIQLTTQVMAYFKLMYYERYGMLLLLALAFIGAGGGFVSALMNTVFRALLTLVGL